MAQNAKRYWTRSEVLGWTVQRFEEQGIVSPSTDAQYLLAHALGCSRVDLFVEHDRELDDNERAAFRELVRRRLAREPVAYIEGKRGFHALDLELAVDPRVLIPRPETEHLVDWLLELLPAEAERPMHILDVGTGSGAIALAIKRARPDLDVHGSDVSDDALAVARANAQRAELAVAFHRADLLAELETQNTGWTAIVANPPYIPTQELEGLEPEVAEFEPRLALDGGKDGLDVIRRLLEQAESSDIWAPAGLLLIEVGIGQATAVAELVAARGFVEIETRRDLAGIERVVKGRRGGDTAAGG